jgi:hypothetical protein
MKYLCQERGLPVRYAPILKDTGGKERGKTASFIVELEPCNRI